jgi:predicted SprT family Zn-dependent metalloprotease
MHLLQVPVQSATEKNGRVRIPATPECLFFCNDCTTAVLSLRRLYQKEDERDYYCNRIFCFSTFRS